MNTGARVVAKIQTPGGRLTYDGDTAIAGAPGTAAPIQLSFMGVVGSSTGAFLPSGNLIDVVDGIELTCMDVAMPIAIARARISDCPVTKAPRNSTPTAIFSREWKRYGLRQAGLWEWATCLNR